MAQWLMDDDAQIRLTEKARVRILADCRFFFTNIQFSDGVWPYDFGKYEREKIRHTGRSIIRTSDPEESSGMRISAGVKTIGGFLKLFLKLEILK